MEYLIAQVFHSIKFPTLKLGIPENLFRILFVTGLLVIIMLQQIWFLGILLLIQLGFKKLTDIDPYFYHILIKTIEHGDVYD